MRRVIAGEGSAAASLSTTAQNPHRSSAGNSTERAVVRLMPQIAAEACPGLMRVSCIFCVTPVMLVLNLIVSCWDALAQFSG